MLFPLLLIGSGFAALVTAIAVRVDDGEPAEPIDMPPDAPTTPVLPTGSPEVDANEIEALARVIASEAGSGTRGEMRAIAWTERNRARAKRKSLYATFYPWRSQSGGNPPASSARPATDATRAMAREVLSAPQAADPTGGATSFFEPKLQDALAEAGALARAGKTGKYTSSQGVPLSNIERFKNYYKNAAQIREKWGKDSAVVAVAGRFEFFGKKSTFLASGGQVRTIVGGDMPGKVFTDIPDPLALLPKYRRRHS